MRRAQQLTPRGALALVATSLLVSCTSDPAPRVPLPLAPVIAAPPPSSTAIVPPGPLVSSPCVLHSGTAKRDRVQSGGVVRDHGSCAYDVECFTKPGEASPGDGFVSVTCEDKTCVCVVESAADHRREETTFPLPNLCASAEEAKKLLVEQCMKGMPAPVNAATPPPEK